MARLVLQTPGHTVVRGTVNADDPIPADCTVTAISRDGALGHGAFVREGEFEFRGLASGVATGTDPSKGGSRDSFKNVEKVAGYV